MLRLQITAVIQLYEGDILERLLNSRNLVKPKASYTGSCLTSSSQTLTVYSINKRNNDPPHLG